MTWDEEFQCLFDSWREIKVIALLPSLVASVKVIIAHLCAQTSKTKLVLFMAGKDRHADFYVDWADFLVLRSPFVFDVDSAVLWLIPGLHKAGKNAGTKLGKWIKDMLPAECGGAQRWYKIRETIKPPLPHGLSAAGLRRGACSEMHRRMPESYAAAASGHSEDKTNIRHYVHPEPANNEPAGRVLADWCAPPYGTRAPGPSPPVVEAQLAFGEDISCPFGVQLDVRTHPTYRPIST